MDSNNSREKIGFFPLALSFMSFIPLVGIAFGIFAITYGATTRRVGGKILIIIGLTGCFFTIILYGSLFYLYNNNQSETYKNQQRGIAQITLNSLFKDIEFYKIQHGTYPASLLSLEASMPKGSYEKNHIFDPRNTTRHQLFFYKKIDQKHYYLRGVSLGGKPFSSGLFGPQVGNISNGIGLLTTIKK